MRPSPPLIAAILAAAAGMLGSPVDSPSRAGQEARKSADQQQPKQGSAIPRAGEATRRAIFGGRIRPHSPRVGWPGYGWPVAHDRRMARKRRNQAKHRAACKRKGSA